MNFWNHERRAITRFASAGAVVFSMVTGLIAVAEPRGLSLASLGVAALELVMLSGGYLLAQSLSVKNRREGWEKSYSHFAAGVSGPLSIALLSTQVQGVNVAGIIGISAGTGVIIGLVQRLVTLRGPSPRVPTQEEQSAELDAEMARLDLLIDGESRVIPIDRPAKEPHRKSEHVA